MALPKENNFYSVLGVTANADTVKLRAAYLKLALKYHPDRNPGDKVAEDRFKTISQAYAILSNPQARARYDKLLRQKKPQTQKAKGPQPQKPTAAPQPQRPTAAPEKTQTQTKTRPQTQTKPPSHQSSSHKTKNSPPPQQPPQPPPQPPPQKATPPFQETPPLRTETPPYIDPEDIILNYFTTPDGQVSLKKIQEELKKSGLSEQPKIWRSLNTRSSNTLLKTNPFWGPFKTKLTKGLKSLKNLILLKPQDPLEYDLLFGLALKPEAALSGTTVVLQYFQDGIEKNLSIHVPPNTRNNTRLRLMGQGNLKPDKTRGDLLITVTIPKGPLFK
ncbi:MAG: DnaJ domain-containing protein [Deltaproteobacteria bacterium]|nr:DnaJ domain-containing protein [Deltaproteobacteria bacterium]